MDVRGKQPLLFIQRDELLIFYRRIDAVTRHLHHARPRGQLPEGGGQQFGIREPRPPVAQHRDGLPDAAVNINGFRRRCGNIPLHNPQVCRLTVGFNVKPRLFQGLHPLGHALFGVNLLLRLAGIERRHVAGLKGRVIPDRLADGPAAAGIRLRRYALQLPHAVFADRFSLIAHRRDVILQRGTVQAAKGNLVRVDILNKPGFTHFVAAERAPLIAMLSGIGHHRVGMQLRLLVAAGIVVKQRHHQVAGQLRLAPALRHNPRGGHRLYLLNGGLHRAVMGLNQTFIATEHGHHGDTFGRREGEVVARTVFVRPVLSPAEVAAVRQASLQNLRKDLLVHPAAEPQRFSPFSGPALAHTTDNVVVVLVGVIIARAAGGFYRSDAHHQMYPPGSRSFSGAR